MNITIIIPTKNRSVFINRQLKYYSESGFSGHIFIGDSSDTHEYQYNKKSIEKYSDYFKIVIKILSPKLNTEIQLFYRQQLNHLLFFSHFLNKFNRIFF